MIFSRAWYALMIRNVIYRKRFYVTTSLELLLPIFGIVGLIVIKNAVENAGGLDSEIIPPSFPSPEKTFVPLTFGDYLTALQAQRLCIKNTEEEMKRTGTELQYHITGIDPTNWQIPLVKCDSLGCRNHLQEATRTVCEYNQIGIAGDATRVQQFMNWLETTYPILQKASDVFPFDHTLFHTFNHSDDMSTYVTSNQYGQYPLYPKLAMGIVFHGNDPDLYDYTLRQNSTNFNMPEEQARSGAATTPSTERMTYDYGKDDTSICPIKGESAPFLGPMMESCTGQYMYNGILTFQRLVHDFILDQTGVRTINGNFVNEASVQYVPFPTRAYTKEGFYSLLSGTLVCFSYNISYRSL
jgi:hypothetical protein